MLKMNEKPQLVQIHFDSWASPVVWICLPERHSGDLWLFPILEELLLIAGSRMPTDPLLSGAN